MKLLKESTFIHSQMDKHKMYRRLQSLSEAPEGSASPNHGPKFLNPYTDQFFGNGTFWADFGQMT
jgi:hypothetical protein